MGRNGRRVGLGVLLDYADWAERNGAKIDVLSSQAIPLSYLKILIKE